MCHFRLLSNDLSLVLYYALLWEMYVVLFLSMCHVMIIILLATATVA